MVKVVIASAVLYYLNLSFWWWIALSIAFLVDMYNEYANNINDFRTVNHLRDIRTMLEKHIYEKNELNF